MFPPSSSATRFRPATPFRCQPTSGLPVKERRSIRGSAASRSASAVDEGTTETAAGGHPASSAIAPSARAESGVLVAGRTITALPAASAGPSLWQTVLSGKLNGVIASTTPTGNRR